MKEQFELPLLALTRLSNIPIANKKPSVLAGSWCLFEPDASSSGTPTELNVHAYHWNDEIKRSEDYAILNEFYERFVTQLSLALNTIHGLNGDKRYWEVILGPWALTYISVIFDRWETVKSILGTHGRIEVGESKFLKILPPKNYAEFVVSALDDDNFNQWIFERALRDQDDCNQIVWRELMPAFNSGTGSSGSVKSGQTLRVSIFEKFLNFLQHNFVLLQLFVSGNRIFPGLQPRVLFIDSYFPRPFLHRLQRLIGQIPYLDVNTFPDAPHIPLTAPHNLRADLAKSIANLDVRVTNPWELLLWELVPHLIPKAAIEDLQFYRHFASTHYTQAQVAVTSNAHWHNEGFKIWAAESIERGLKMVIAEHGGGFPVKDYCFGFEENVSEICVKNLEKYHPKHVKLRLPKYAQVHLESRLLDVRKQTIPQPYGILVVPYQGGRYTIRANSQIKSHQSIDSLHFNIRALNMLSDRIGSQIRVKVPQSPHLAGGTSLRLVYESHCRMPITIVEGPLGPVLSSAKIILCTYPESSFAECLMSGVPVILLYDLNVNVSHAVVQPIIELLRRAGIIFNDPKLAAEHIETVWEYPEKWWESEEVAYARHAYLAKQLVTAEDPMNSWVATLRKE